MGPNRDGVGQAGAAGSRILRWFWGLGLYLASRRLWAISTLAAGAIVGQLVWRSGITAAPPSIGDRELVALSPVLAVVAVSGSLPSFLTEWEDMHVITLRKLRAAHLTLAVVACLLGAWPVGRTAGDSWWIGRNALLLLGLTLLSSVVFDPHLNWVAPVCCVGLCYFFGRGDSEMAAPKAWALLLRPESSQAVTLSVVVMVAGLLVYITHGPRRTQAPEAV